MTAEDVQTILQEAILTILLASGPVLIAALAIGMAIALFQALTSIQEMTLTFVPKIIGIFGILILSMPYMYWRISELADKIFDLIAKGLN
jgi:flagellar biosynthetic protein FliQ